jgi:hypothetical protein
MLLRQVATLSFQDGGQLVWAHLVHISLLAVRRDLPGSQRATNARRDWSRFWLRCDTFLMLFYA